MTFVKKCGLQPYDWLGRFRKKSIKDWDIFKWFKYLIFFYFFFF